MEELIEILINLIASFFQNKAIKTIKPVPPPRAMPAIRVEPPSRAPITAKMPTARKGKRRQPPPMIAVARPIMTPPVSNATPPMVPMVRSTITANAGILQPNQTPSQSADSIRKWMTPSTLKHQFLLTEILQKPLALREPR